MCNKSVDHSHQKWCACGCIIGTELREIEKTKIECARKFFDALNNKIGNRNLNPDNVKYDVVNSYGKLMEIVGVV